MLKELKDSLKDKRAKFRMPDKLLNGIHVVSKYMSKLAGIGIFGWGLLAVGSAVVVAMHMHGITPHWLPRHWIGYPSMTFGALMSVKSFVVHHAFKAAHKKAAKVKETRAIHTAYKIVAPEGPSAKLADNPAVAAAFNPAAAVVTNNAQPAAPAAVTAPAPST